MHTNDEPNEGNGSVCSGCLIQDCRAQESQGGLRLSGWRLSLASTGLFLGPCVLAIAGAACFAENRGAQLAGAIAGLGIGMIGSVVAARVLRQAGKAESTKKSA